MDDYNDYVTAINKIYDYVSRVKAGWNNPDNYANIDKLDEFKSLVAESADEFKKPAAEVIEEPPTTPETTPPSRKDELFFPEPEMDTIPKHIEEGNVTDITNIETGTATPKVNLKPTYEMTPIRLKDGVVPSGSSTSQQLTKLDTTKIPSLGDNIEENTNDFLSNNNEGTEEL